MTDNSVTDCVDRLIDNAIDTICGGITDPEVRDCCGDHMSSTIYQLVTDVRELDSDQTRQLLMDLDHEHHSKITAFVHELDKQKLHRQLANKAITDVAILRQYLNQTFDNLWQTHGLSLSDDEILIMAQGLPLIKRPDRIRTSHGLKLAVCVLSGRCELVDRQLCEFYVAINDHHHPRTKPITEVVNCVANLKRTIREDALPKMYQNMGMTEDILDKIGHLLVMP